MVDMAARCRVAFRKAHYGAARYNGHGECLTFIGDSVSAQTRTCRRCFIGANIVAHIISVMVDATHFSLHTDAMFIKAHISEEKILTMLRIVRLSKLKDLLKCLPNLAESIIVLHL